MSIDYVRNGGGIRCYWHDEEKGFIPNDDVDQYRKVNTCPTTTGSTPEECVPEFTALEDVGSIGGVRNTELLELEACKEYCNDEEDCVGFDFNVAQSANPCWFFTDEDKLIQSAFERVGIVQYRIERRCERKLVNFLLSQICYIVR